MEFAIYVCISFCNTCTGLWLGYGKVGLDSVLVDLLGGGSGVWWHNRMLQHNHINR